MINTIEYGDNLEIMKRLNSSSIDLIYLDPPFNSKRNYNQIYKDEYGNPLPEEALAFCDTWVLTKDKENEILNSSIELKRCGADDNFIQFWETWILALRHTNTQTLSYLFFMTIRLWEMQRILKDTGSLYLHCDPTASHYIKIIMDAVFGHNNFINEIIWCYRTGGGTKKHWAKKHDILLMYAKNNKQKYFKAIKEKSYLTAKFGFKKTKNLIQQETDGRYYTFVNCRDYWNIDAIGRSSKERLGYPTQKPIKLLERVIEASCPENGIILDPFCGCGTTLDAAEGLKRHWKGIDICLLAAKKMEKRLISKYQLKKGKDYHITGIPVTISQVDEMIHTNNNSKNEGRYQFQYWAIEQVGGFASTKKSGDGGVDGSIYFYLSLNDMMEQKAYRLGRMILSVKSDKKMSISYIRDLIGTMHNKKADICGLICYDIPTDGMYATARESGMFKINYILNQIIEIPKVQILTVNDIMDGKTFILPNWSKIKETKI